MDALQNYQNSTVTSESWGTRLHPQNTHLLWEFPSQNKNTCRAAQKEFFILETGCEKVSEQIGLFFVSFKYGVKFCLLNWLCSHLILVTTNVFIVLGFFFVSFKL